MADCRVRRALTTSWPAFAASFTVATGKRAVAALRPLGRPATIATVMGESTWIR